MICRFQDIWFRVGQNVNADEHFSIRRSMLSVPAVLAERIVVAEAGFSQLYEIFCVF